MKELEKTKRISIASTLFILIILIAVLSYKRPKHLYKANSKITLEKMISNDYFVSLDEINNPDYVLIDVRSQFEFEKGHLENALNIYAPEILSDDNTAVFEELKEKNKTAILYGKNPNDVNAPFMLLYQLGYDNLKILTVENSYNENKLITKNTEIEKSVADVNAFIAESIKKASINSDKEVVVKKVVKKVITVKKKKKAPAEGGC
ncbi:rhodanese-like domain-containing protein [Lutibacter sp.]|uniref:rhodanese-like domain-containing protein n=1 Tax=Lutibacter sp. TaxID=1925666 RepID=UPI003569BE6B